MLWNTKTRIFAVAAFAMTAGWTSGDAAAQAGDPSRVEPFTIDVAQDVLEDLESRLARTRWPHQPAGTGWEQGADTAYMRELADYWLNDYDWRAQEARLNSFDHYRARIDGMSVHFVHARSRDPDAIPLLMLHGWPSSFVQMLDIIPLLTDPPGDGPAFHVVAASIPGFGFSDPPNRTLFGFPSSARVMIELMSEVLGYERYGVRGSDIGGVVVRQMAVIAPEQIIGVHLTGIIGIGGGVPPYTAAEEAFIEASGAIEPEIAYARVHSSKPQTLAHSLNDSPIGLAA